MADKSDLIKAAQKHLAKGNVDKAIAEWEKLAAAYPDGNVLNFMGDLYLKKADKKSAAEAYHKSAKAYTGEGFSHKAIAIYKKILNFSPHDAPSLIALGELSEEKAITTDAIRFYIAAADVLSKENKKGELLAVYEKILKLAPKNVNLRMKIADLFSKEAFVKEAAAEYYNVGLLHLEAGNAEGARACLLKSRELQPNSRDTILALSRLYEQAGDFSQARQYVSEAMERTGEDVSLLLRSADLLAKAGSGDEAEAVLKRVVEADPSNMGARSQLASLYEGAGRREKAWQQYSVVAEDLAANNRVEEAITLLTAYKDLDPIENGRRLVLYLRQAGNEEQAVREMVDLHEAYLGFGMKEEAAGCLRDALGVQPFNQALKDRLDALESRPAEAGRPDEEPPSEGGWPSFDTGAEAETPGLGGGQEPWPSIEAGPQAEEPSWPGEAGEPWPSAGPEAEGHGQEEGEKSLEELITEADVFLKYGLYTEARAVLEKLKVEAPQNVDVHLRLKSLYRDVDDTEQAVAECLALSALATRAGDAEKGRAFLAEAFEIDPDDPRLQGKAASKEAAPEKPAEAFNRAPGAFKPAEGPFEEPAGEAQPGPVSDFESMLSDLDKEFAAPDISEPEVPKPPLESEVADIFEEFKRGLAKEIEAEDAETHYNLGIAYKEMGLTDDSIKEFQVSKVDPKFYVQSMTMLGICYMEKGLYPLAAEAFTGALMKVGKNEDSALSIKYDLAEAYEKTGKMSEALDLYTQVYGWNARFRDVSAKLNSLKGPASPQEKPRIKKSRVSYL